MQRRVYVYGVAVSIAVALCASVTYADGALWGDIDKPLANDPAAEATSVDPGNVVPGGYAAPGAYATPANPAAPIKSEDINALVNPKTPEEQKNVCDVLTQQTVLTPEAINNLKSNQNLPDNYKAALANPETANSLYQQFRAQYLQTKCGGVVSSSVPSPTVSPPALVTK